tara:strand:+ start:4759 stop:5373 length:615 start_codon:yes stop_codon:yes gene_type:complete
MKTETANQLYTRQEVAKRLSVSTKTIDRLRQSGQLATKWVGENSPRITGDSLRRFLTAAGCVAFMTVASAVEINGKLIHAVAMVESNNNHRAVGDQGKANGAFQMWKPAWQDCSKWLKRNGFKTTTYEKGVNDPTISHQYCKVYLSILNSQLRRSIGREPSAAELYAAYNLGFTGFKRRGFDISKTPSITQRAAVKLNRFLEAE